MRLREQLDVRKYYEELRRRLEPSQYDIYELERLAELVAQSLIDLAAMYMRGKPPTYRALLEQFGREIGYDPQRLGAVAALRNVLIHRYFATSVEKELAAFKNLVEMMPQVINLAERVIGDNPRIEDAKRLGEVFKNTE
ncbi:MAG: HepT-like ribonuclease domain-containing protein [Pyrobaculum sp.]